MESKKREDEVPVFQSWNAWYLLLVVFLIVQILFFYLLTLGFNE